MLSQRQMKEWIPETIELFKSVMASNHAPFPEICIVSDRCDNPCIGKNDTYSGV